MPTKETVMASKSGVAIASAQAGQVTIQRGSYLLTAADAIDAALQLRIVKLPAQHRIVDLALDNDSIDTSTGAAIDIGIEDSIQDPADTTNLTLFTSAVDVQTDGNRQKVMTAAAALLAAVDYDRFIVVTIETVATTGEIGYIALTLTSMPELGSQFDGNA